jgi:class 3 adenylate cyclase/TolB-like protein
MAEERAHRHLAAILAADVVGYSRLMEANEVATFERLRAHRKELFEPEIAKHHGRIFKLMGDGLLAEFASVVDAVECAVVLQHGMTERNTGLGDDQRIDVRIGINLGDVIVEEDDRHGEGVIIAARLQQLAEPGSIYVSQTVVDHVQHKLALRFAFCGDHHIKNVDNPIAVYRVSTKEPVGRPRIFGPRWQLRRRWKTATLVIVLLIVANVGLIGWYYFSDTLTPLQRLSIVVLPFKTPDGSPEDRYLSEGILSDLTTDLSRIEGSFVISANTAATYEGKIVDPKQIARELNVRYILEGSLRRVGPRVRINAQLIDAATGGVAWADRIEGDWANFVELQDQITGQLARTLDLELIAAESRRAQSERPHKPDAVDLAMRGWSILNQPLARKHVSDAQQLFEQALRLDPDLPRALVGLGRTLTTAVNARWSTTRDDDLARADDAVTRALLANANDAMAHYVKGEVFRGRKDFESAIAEYKFAISIDRNLAPAYATLGNTYIRAGRTKEAFEPLATAIRLSPRDPLLNIWYYWTCHAHIHLAQDKLAIEWCRRSVGLNPYWAAYIDLAAAYGWTGQKSEARAALAELEKLMPNYTVDRWRNEGWSDNPIFLAEYQHIIEGLQKAGMREK